jgi:hypothetical protein
MYFISGSLISKEGCISFVSDPLLIAWDSQLLYVVHCLICLAFGVESGLMEARGDSRKRL